MKISSFDIENYRSIDKTGASGLGSLVVLIGKNSSGKSNVLEGLASVFQNFDVAGGSTPGIDDYVFHKRRTNKPARFAVTLEFTPEELARIFPTEWIQFYERLLAESKVSPREQMYRVKFVRELRAPQGIWTTPQLDWGRVPILGPAGQVAPDELNKAVQELAQSLGATIVPPATGAGSQVVQGTASAASASDVVKPPLLIPTFLAKDLVTALGELAKLIKGRFRLISIARDIKTPGVLRDTIVDASAQNQLWTLDQSTKVEDEAALRRVDSAFESVTGESLDFVASRAYLRKEADRIPLALEGGGFQSSFNLTATLYTNPSGLGVCALEEPEGHAHPELQRRLFDSMRALSDRAQIFVATHSQIFVDRVTPGSLYIVKNGEGGTKIEPPSTYAEVLHELGARPSDLFFSSKVLLVEGLSELIVIPAIAKGAGIDFSDTQVLQTGGKGGARARAETLLEFARDMVVPFVLFDKDGAGDAEKLTTAGLIPHAGVRALALGSIEEYYPRNLVEKAVEELDRSYDLKIRESPGWKKVKDGQLPIAKFDVGHRAVGLAGGWKVVLARTIAPELARDSRNVPDELLRFLRTVADAEPRTPGV
jgi:ABC-type arginine transport system ATPase subunit